ncbi:DNA gyrase inhibitor YacG [Nitrincola tapanii]|uniref:DNA gyrase inhibitor YacG n=1 Tax=Nitrincola tapanii TaxID=1708751 RepID=A0A5A9W1L9_9GAMM|nr:DNA gyrase inhibitor YacG [Nitrincola tapanii]KAA0874109.1 DNA gyrase inhibitor YacG [Nitrincola tapanii]
MKQRQIPCPTCGEPALYAPSNPDRPFCSKRCRLIDLGEWASEGYAIEAKERPDWEENILNPESSELLKH